MVRIRQSAAQELFSFFAHDLRLRDCIAGMAQLPERCVDITVTSPPYNLGIKYGKYSDKESRESYLQWCREWAGEIRRVLKGQGSLFLNIGSAPSSPMLPHELVMQLRDVFVLQNVIHWVKSIRRARSARHRSSIPGQKQHCALVAYSWKRSTLSRQHVVHSLRDDSEPCKGATASGDVSCSTRRMVYQAARSVAN